MAARWRIRRRVSRMRALRREAALDTNAADRAPAGQLGTLPDLDSVVWPRPGGIDRDEFSGRWVAAPEKFVAAVCDWHRAESLIAGRLQISSRVCDSLSAFAAACSVAVSLAAGHFVLDLPGTQLSFRLVSGGGTRSIARRVRAVHGFFSGHDCWARLPHA